MTDERKPNGWTESALEAVIAWFPDLPKFIRVIFASATIYLVLCLVAQVNPVALFEAGGNAARSWVLDNRATDAQYRAAITQERADMIQLLREQNNDLRGQIRRPSTGTEGRLYELERKVDALLHAHPKVKP